MKLLYKSLLASILILTLIPLVYASDDQTVDIGEFDDYLAERLNIPLFAAQMMTGMLVIALFLFPTLMLTKGQENQLLIGLVVGLGAMGFNIAMGWWPYWLLLIIAFITALMFSGTMRNFISGKGGD